MYGPNLAPRVAAMTNRGEDDMADQFGASVRAGTWSRSSRVLAPRRDGVKRRLTLPTYRPNRRTESTRRVEAGRRPAIPPSAGGESLRGLPRRHRARREGDGSRES